MRQLADLWKLEILYDDYYGLVEFLRMVVGKEHERCRHCYELRLRQTATAAKRLGFEAFSATLLISPYQNFELLAQIGQSVAQDVNIDFYCEDFRPGFRESTRLSKEMGLYRQKYCGCIYSEMDSYVKLGAKANLDKR